MTRFLRGYVRAQLLGGYPERLISTAAQAGVELWAVRRDGLAVSFCCFADRYSRLRPIFRHSGARLRVTARRGLPFLLRPFRRRWGLAVGAVAAVVLLSLLSSRVWVITVDGNERISDSAILAVLEPLGVAVGMDFDDVNIPQVQLAALKALPTVDWLTVNQQGSTVQVLLREREMTVSHEETAPANVVAACDGEVVEIRVFDGQAAVKVGDGVTQGALLISGVTDSAVGPLLRRARGMVTARVRETITVRVPLEETVRTVARRENRPTAVLFGCRVPLYTNTGDGGVYTEKTHNRLLTAHGKTLPIGWTVTERVYFEDVAIFRTAPQALAVAYERAAQREAALEGMTVQSRSVTEQQDEAAVEVSLCLVGLREIGVSEPIAVQ